MLNKMLNNRKTELRSRVVKLFREMLDMAIFIIVMTLVCMVITRAFHWVYNLIY